jgi:hypothetical protein
MSFSVSGTKVNIKIKVKNLRAVCWWLMTPFLATWEAEIRRIAVPGTQIF